MHPTPDDVRSPVAVQIANVSSDQMGRVSTDGVSRKLLIAIVFQPDHPVTGQVFPILVRAAHEAVRGDNVQIAVAVHVDGIGRIGAVEPGQIVMDELSD